MPRRIRALLFDFDGTLWDSESAVFEAYRRLYASHGEELPMERWAAGVGTLGDYDPVAELETRLGRALEELEGGDPWDHLGDELDGVGLRPGVRATIGQAEELGLALGIVSSNDRAWVERHLARLDLGEGWDVIATADGDERRAKPSPALYVEALAELAMTPGEALALEDSPHGITAAKTAGVFCVAVPNEVTASLDLSKADLVIGSLEERPLTELIAVAERTRSEA